MTAPAATGAAGTTATTTTTTATSSSAGTASGAAGTIASAAAICVRRNRELAAVPESGGDLRTLAGAASRRAAIESQALRELDKLTPPAKVARDYRGMLVGNAATLRQVRKLAAAAQANDPAAVDAARTAAARGQLRVLTAAARAGLRDCYTID